MAQKRSVVPDGLKLFKYQRDGVKFVAARRRAIIADVMGLGKTPQAIVAANVWSTTNCVVICPAVVRSTWEMEWKKWSTLSHSVTVVNGGKQSVAANCNVLIVSYDLSITPKWKQFIQVFLKRSENSLLIVDEAHNCKNWRAQRTRAVIIDILPCTKRALFLTGTPMTKSVIDLHPLFCACEPRKWGKLTEFGARYSHAVETAFGIEYRGLRNVDELKKRYANFMVRRFKEDVQKELPEKMYINVWLSVDAAIAARSMESAAKVEEAIRLDKQVADENTATMRRELGLAKVQSTCEWIDNFLESEPDEPLVIFAYHKAVVASIYEHLKKKGLKVCKITGETSAEDRKLAVDGFQSGEFQVFIGNLVAAGVGITLHRAATALVTELDWRPDVVAQACDRLHRIGQKRTVKIYFLLAKDSIDMAVINVIRSKMKVIGEALGDKD